LNGHRSKRKREKFVRGEVRGLGGDYILKSFEMFSNLDFTMRKLRSHWKNSWQRI
jgi:hypothetical protein